jgi:mannose-1-phosphate guanylyltransferase
MTTHANLQDIHIAILAGGSGTRLWPLSRRATPKQLLNLVGGRSLLRRTVDRVLPLVSPERIYILTGPEHAAAIHAQLPELLAENLFIEPSPRGTAPCLGLAAARLRERHPAQSVMISLHADHMILDEERFRAALLATVTAARKGYLVTVGIVPSCPETGFGYIERGRQVFSDQGLPVYRVARFTEKPPLREAQEFVASGRFYWNAGYFAWTLDNILEEFQRLRPELYARLDAMVAAYGSPSYERIWEQIAPLSIDVGIMERARQVAVAPCDMGWSDIGSWSALQDILPRDEAGNVALGKGTHVALDTRNSLVYSGKRLVATIGLEEMIVIETDDALLVLPRSRAQDVSALVQELRARGLDELL